MNRVLFKKTPKAFTHVWSTLSVGESIPDREHGSVPALARDSFEAPACLFGLYEANFA
jgi:hypothetical protein